METTEAYRTLRLDPSADGSMVQSAYWALVRKARDRGARDLDARAEIDRLNDAYSTLQPGANRYDPSPARGLSPPPVGTEFVDRAVDWLSEEALRTRYRWSGRNAEIAVIGGTALFLMIVALASGSSFWLVALSAVLIFGAIWAPWRRVHMPEPDDDEDRASSLKR